MAYWLMKSEPSTFSIEDLAQRPQQQDRWDGVRNYQVRNWLRDTFQPNDQAFFYHSSCQYPGIVGIIKIISRGYPDPSAWDMQSDYYDPHSTPEQPRWYCVDIELVEQFPQMVSLSQLRAHPELQQMPLLQKGNRLSITPIQASEWEYILQLAKS